MNNSRWVHINVDEILKETDKALLCQFGDEEIWIPLSQIADADHYTAGDCDCTISIAEWFAREKGLGE